MSDRQRPAALLAFALVVPMTVAGAAHAQGKDIRVSGIGIRKCAEWMEWKEKQNGEARALALEWAQGFIAGHNVFARTGGEPVNSVVADSKVLVPLLDSYCQKNPEARLLNGVIAITQSLGGAKLNITPKAPPKNQRPDAQPQRES